jgi:hypothetical protein
MAQTAAQRKRNQRARDRARLGDEEYRRIERDKMRAYRASKRSPKKTIIINNQPQPQPQSKYKKPIKTKGTSTTNKSTTASSKRLCTNVQVT